MIGLSIQGAPAQSGIMNSRKSAPNTGSKVSSSVSPNKKRDPVFDNFFSNQLVENTSQRLNMMLSDKKAKKIDDIKYRLVDYDPSDMDKKVLVQLLSKEKKGKSREHKVSAMMKEEEKERMLIHKEW